MSTAEETYEEREARVRKMIDPDQREWDLSDKDVAALKWVLFMAQQYPRYETMCEDADRIIHKHRELMGRGHTSPFDCESFDGFEVLEAELARMRRDREVLLGACQRFSEYENARNELEHLPGGTNEDERLRKLCHEIETHISAAITFARRP